MPYSKYLVHLFILNTLLTSCTKDDAHILLSIAPGEYLMHKVYDGQISAGIGEQVHISIGDNNTLLLDNWEFETALTVEVNYDLLTINEQLFIINDDYHKGVEFRVSGSGTFHKNKIVLDFVDDEHLPSNGYRLISTGTAYLYKISDE